MLIRPFLMATLSIGVCLLGFLAVSGPAKAEPLAMAGQERNSCCSKVAVPTPGGGTLVGSGAYTPFNPSAGQFGAVVLTAPNPGLNVGPDAPYGIKVDATASQGVTQMGVQPHTLTLPPNLFALTNMFTDSPGTSFTLLQTTIDLANETGMFSAGGGPGTTGFCRGTGLSVTSCAVPGGGGDTNFPWRLSYEAGTNQYGGTMRLLGTTAGIAKFKPASLGGVNRNVYFSFPNAAMGGNVGQIQNIDNIIRFTLNGNPQPITIPTPGGGTIMTATLPNTSFVTGGPLTTGLVRASVTRATSPFLYQVATNTGYDNRDAAGHGNIQLVSPLVFTNTGSNKSFPRVYKYTLTLPEPGLAWMIGAGTLSLVALAGRRRKHMRDA